MAGVNQHLQTTQFYRPYDSEDESGSDAESASTDSWYSSGMDQSAAPSRTIEGHPDFKAFATQMQLIDAAGRSFSTIKDELIYGNDRLGKYTVYSQYDAPKPQPDLSGEEFYGRTKFVTADGNETSIIMIDSRYRDRIAYPQPTYCTLRLPRIYKNITAINMVEMKLLTSFYFFRPSKANTDITVYERDRMTFNPFTCTITSTIVKRYIDTGSYTIDQLQAEIQQKLNYTPLFYDYPNGIGGFIDLFAATGDYGANFNEPGDWFYNNTTNQWIANPTKDTIVSHFWKGRYAGLTGYTNDQYSMAYYYPVLSEALQDEEFPTDTINLQPGIGIDPTVTTIEDVRDRIIYTFQGINPPDPVVLAVIQNTANKASLNDYRLKHTFRYYLVNKYVVNRDAQSQQVYITSPSLNTSLVRLLNIQQNRYFTTALQQNGITPTQYAQLATSISRALAVIQGMYDFTQTRFLDYFAVPWSQYTLDYYSQLGYTFQLRNGTNVTGIANDWSNAVDLGVVPASNNIILPLQSNPPVYWPNMSNLPPSTIFMTNLSTATSTFNLVYRMSASNFDDRTPFIDSNTNYFYTDYLTNTVNTVCPISPGQYTVFKFLSPVRQTLQVETLPRPSAYRIPLYNQCNFDAQINQYFDLSYAFQFTSNAPYPPSTGPNYTIAFDNLPSSNLNQIPGWSPANSSNTDPNYSWAQGFVSSANEYTSSISVDILTTRRGSFFQFTTPEVSNADPNSNYTYTLNLTAQMYDGAFTSNISTPIVDTRMFVYHDRSAFQADVYNIRNESPLFYKFSTVVTTTQSNATITFTAYPKQTYYVSLRPDITNFGNIYTRVFPWFSNPFTLTPQSLSVQGINPATDICGASFPSLIASNFNYAKVYDSNWIRLPINSNLWAPDPSSNAGNAILSISNVPMGYDSNGISTDWTDYIPYWIQSSPVPPPFGSNSYQYSFYPPNTLAMDPINKYFFQCNSPYNSTTQTYLSPDGNNAILTPAFFNVYNPTAIANRQYKIAHYYSVNYIQESDSNYPLASSLISASNQAQQPYTISTTQGVRLSNYQYGGGSQSTLQLSRGVMGFNFIPSEGVWNLKQIMFRSAISDSNADPNVAIQYLGVYNMYDILNTNTTQLSLSSAITVLSNSARVTYTSTFTQSNFGFDVKGGTYYDFQTDTSFVQQVPSQILGYTQSPNTMSDQPESMYCAVAFNQYGTPTTIKALSGSAVPYPFYSQVYTSTSYLDGTKPYDIGDGIVFPSTIGQNNWPFATSQSTIFAPPSGIDATQSQYAQSIPIGTSVLNYKRGISLSADSNFLQPWTTTLTPNTVIGTVSNFVLFQDTNFTVYPYTGNQPTRQFTDPVWNFTADEVFSAESFTSLVAVSGNSSWYYFLGFSNDANTSNYLKLKRMDPRNGIIYDYTLDSSFRVPFGGGVKSFTINDAEQLVVTYQESAAQTKLYYNLLPSTNMTATASVNALSTAIHAIDPTTNSVYWMPLNSSNEGMSVYNWTIGGSFPGTLWNLQGPPTMWTNIAVNAASNVPSANDRLFFINPTRSYGSNLYYSDIWNSGTNTITVAKVSTPVTTLAGTGQAIQSVTSGINGSIWVTAANSPVVWGNRNTEIDTGGIIDSAWQIFYPFQKVVLEKVANAYNPIPDLTYLDYPEYPHTAMFYYRNGAKLLADTSNKWGLERNSNFTVADPRMQGYYFNSYVFNVPLEESSNATDYQYLTVRGYTPTESSETLIRFVLPNRYDFGYLKQTDLFAEISTLQVTSANFNPTYAAVLSNFDIAYQQSNSFFGANLAPDFNGSNLNSSNFQQFANNYSNLYNSYQSNANLLSNITQYVNSNMTIFISSQLQYILPASALRRQNFTDPLTFKLLWLTGLLPQYRPLLEDWGLGYNLGYVKRDTPYSTYHQATSFYKILEDYIYLRLNPEYQMNRLDTTYKENFNVTRDSTGQINNFHGKLLLNDFNTYSRSFVSNQVTFNPPIGRLDQMYFEWVNVVGDRIDDFDCEWSCSLNITENKQRATVQSTLPALPPAGNK